MLLAHTHTTSELLAELTHKLRLRIVIVDCPYDTIHSDDRVQQLFGRLVGLKIQGYRNQYPYGALPVDASDYFGVHILLCEETLNRQLNPLTGFKSVTLERCKNFQTHFPLEHVMEGKAANLHRAFVQRVLAQAEKNGEPVAYNSSWTIRPDLTRDRDLRNFCRDISMFFLVRYYEDARIPHCFAGAAVRFKVHQLKEAVGFEYLTGQDGPLPAFPCEPFYGEPIHLMYLRKATEEARRWAHLFDPLWESRIILRSNEAQSASNLKAA
jgi:hypothetical protein